MGRSTHTRFAWAALLMGSLILVLMLSTLIGFAPQPGGGSARVSSGDPFRIDARPPTLGYLSTSETPVDGDLIGVPMISELAGVVAQIEPRRFATLRHALSRRPVDTELLIDDNLLGYLHLSRAKNLRRYALYATSPDTLALRSLDEPTQSWGISRAVFGRIGVRLPEPKSEQPDYALPGTDGEAGAGDGTARRLVLPHPYIQSETLLDLKTIRARIRQGYPRLTRTLDDELFRVRLPKGYNPSFPAGVLVWISPMPDGRIPRIFEPICDKLGLIAIGVDNNGNKRSITDRLQNHLDSIETLAEHYRIDRQRVYLTGMSGGGRCSGILEIGFPDLFAGAVPIVGLDTYHKAPTGDPGKYWPAHQGKPAARWLKLLRTRRIAAITGTADFNKPEMVIRKGLLERDGLDIRLDIIEGMAHAMPTDEQFASALDWVDEPRRDAMIKSFKRSKSIMSDYAQRFGAAPPTTPAARRMLIDAITLAPYTDPAFTAADLLGYPRTDEPTGDHP